MHKAVTDTSLGDKQIALAGVICEFSPRNNYSRIIMDSFSGAMSVK